MIVKLKTLRSFNVGGNIFLRGQAAEVDDATGARLVSSGRFVEIAAAAAPAAPAAPAPAAKEPAKAAETKDAAKEPAKTAETAKAADAKTTDAKKDEPKVAV